MAIAEAIEQRRARVAERHAGGASNRQIGRELGISRETVRTILKDLGLDTGANGSYRPPGIGEKISDAKRGKPRPDQSERLKERHREQGHHAPERRSCKRCGADLGLVYLSQDQEFCSGSCAALWRSPETSARLFEAFRVGLLPARALLEYSWNPWSASARRRWKGRWGGRLAGRLGGKKASWTEKQARNLLRLHNGRQAGYRTLSKVSGLSVKQVRTAIAWARTHPEG